jgi:hypothetical protein
MACIALIGGVVQLPIMLNADYDVEQMIDRTLCLVAVAVSPALPLAITCGVIFAI